MTPYKQTDSRWKNIKLGSCSTTIGSNGCLITSLGMIADLTPARVNEVYNAHDGYVSGCLVAGGDYCANLIGLSYDADRTKAVTYPIVAEVVTNKTYQHFVVLTSPTKMIDPLLGYETDYRYSIKNYRNYYKKENTMEKIKNAEMVVLPNGNLDWHIPNPETREKYFGDGQKVTTINAEAWKYKDSPTVYWTFQDAPSFTSVDKWSNVKEIERPTVQPDMTKYVTIEEYNKLKDKLERIIKITKE